MFVKLLPLLQLKQSTLYSILVWTSRWEVYEGISEFIREPLLIVCHTARYNILFCSFETLSWNGSRKECKYVTEQTTDGTSVLLLVSFTV